MFQALRQRNIALLFGGQLVSSAGDLVLFIALPFWVFALTGSALATGMMFAALTLPQLLFSPIAGVFVDRWDRRRVMIGADILRAVILMGYLFVNSVEQVWLIYVLAFLESSVSQFFRPSVIALVPTLVTEEQDLTRANAALGAGYSVGQLVGPALGGLLVAAFGPQSAALFDAVTYLLSAGLLLLMRVPVREQVVAAAQATGELLAGVWGELREGVRVVLGRPLLRTVIAAIGILMLSQGIINVLLIVITTELWNAGAQELGWVISAEGLGGIVGTVVAGGLASRVSPKQLSVGGAAIAGVLFIAMVNQPSVYVAMGLIALSGICIVTFDVGLTTLLQEGSDDANRGRVAGLMQTVMALSKLISIAFTAVLAERLGAVLLLDMAGALFILGGVALLFAPRKTVAAGSGGGIQQPAE